MTGWICPQQMFSIEFANSACRSENLAPTSQNKDIFKTLNARQNYWNFSFSYSLSYWDAWCGAQVDVMEVWLRPAPSSHLLHNLILPTINKLMKNRYLLILWSNWERNELCLILSSALSREDIHQSADKQHALNSLNPSKFFLLHSYQPWKQETAT